MYVNSKVSFFKKIHLTSISANVARFVCCWHLADVELLGTKQKWQVQRLKGKVFTLGAWQVFQTFTQSRWAFKQPSAVRLWAIDFSCCPSPALLQLRTTTNSSMNRSETTCIALLQTRRLVQETNLGKVFVGGLMNLDQCLPQTQPRHPFQRPWSRRTRG